MKIQTNKVNRFGGQSRLSGEIVKWDVNGVAEVSNKLGDEILEKYSDSVFKEGEKPIVEAKKDQNVDSSNITKELEKVIKGLKGKNQELVGKNKELETLVLEMKEDIEVNISDKDIDLIIDIVGKSKTKLSETAVGLTFPKEEWEELNHKDLAKYIVKKTLNANTQLNE